MHTQLHTRSKRAAIYAVRAQKSQIQFCRCLPDQLNTKHEDVEAEAKVVHERLQSSNNPLVPLRSFPNFTPNQRLPSNPMTHSKTRIDKNHVMDRILAVFLS